jgi:hypothetical protein
MSKEIRPFGFALNVDNVSKEEIKQFMALWDKIKPTELSQNEEAVKKLKEDRDHYKKLFNNDIVSYRAKALSMAHSRSNNVSTEDMLTDANKIYQWLTQDGSIFDTSEYSEGVVNTGQ